jgi:hypothetical protein
VSLEAVAAHVREQAQACRRLGSPLYGVLLDRVAGDVLAGGPSAAVLESHEGDPSRTALAIRLVGTVHRFALSGEAPDLAAHYPSCGGDGDAAAAWPPFREVLLSRPDDVRAGLASPPQTNEVGRAAPLFGALLRLLGERSCLLPVRLWEIGTSAGLNLRADAFAYRAGNGGAWGPAGSPVLLDPAWDAVPASAPERVDVVERVGGDLFPLDPTTEDGALRLASYVWPDQLQRLARLRGAIEVARRMPARLVTAGAARLLDGLELADGTLTVVWHSVMWQYLDAGEQEAVMRGLAELGSAAEPTRPLAHVAFEPRRGMFENSYRFMVTARTWPGGEQREVGEAPPHGLPVAWAH